VLLLQNTSDRVNYKEQRFVLTVLEAGKVKINGPISGKDLPTASSYVGKQKGKRG
jgi:hypothetical protein